MSLTAADIAKLAPDAATASAGSALGDARKWQSPGQSPDGALVWGQLQGSGKTPYQTVAETSGAGARCSCPSRKFPCKHAVGLWLAFAGGAGLFLAAEPPAWAVDWAAGRAKRAAKAAETAGEGGPADVPQTSPASAVASAPEAPKAKPPKNASRLSSRRAETMTEGVGLLTHWLRDLARQGVSTLPARARSGDVEAIGRRMVDHQLPGLAQRLDELRKQALLPDGHPGREAGWLAAVGQLYGLCEAWTRYESLPAPLAADVLGLLGLAPDLDGLRSGAADGGEAVADRWTVLSAETAPQGKILAETAWLWGERHRRFARVDQFFPKGQKPAEGWEPGRAYEAEMVFLPSTVPLRAIARARRPVAPGVEAVTAAGSAAEAVLQALPTRGPETPDLPAEFARYRDALGRLPWLGVFPLWLKGVRLAHGPAPGLAGWALTDAGETMALPLGPVGQRAFALLAIGEGREMDVVGQWSGEVFWPWLARGTEGRWEVLA